MWLWSSKGGNWRCYYFVFLFWHSRFLYLLCPNPTPDHLKYHHLQQHCFLLLMDLYRSFETNLKSISIKCSFLIPWMSMFNLTISSKNNTLLLLLACSWWCSCVPCTCYIAVCGCWQGVCGGCCQYKEEFGISFSFFRTIFRPIINTHVILVVNMRLLMIFADLRVWRWWSKASCWYE